MVATTIVPVEYVSGGAWATCDRCASKVRHNTLAKEWTGLMVCKTTCFDPRPPELDAPQLGPEGLPVPNPRPDPPLVFITTPVTPDDL